MGEEDQHRAGSGRRGRAARRVRRRGRARTLRAAHRRSDTHNPHQIDNFLKSLQGPFDRETCHKWPICTMKNRKTQPLRSFSWPAWVGQDSARRASTVRHTYVSIGHIYVSAGHTCVGIGHTRVSIGYIYVSVGHTCVGSGHIRVIVGHTYVSVGHTCVSIGHTRVRVSHGERWGGEGRGGRQQAVRSRCGPPSISSGRVFIMNTTSHRGSGLFSSN